MYVCKLHVIIKLNYISKCSYSKFRKPGNGFALSWKMKIFSVKKVAGDGM